jgi:hypothetical protein
MTLTEIKAKQSIYSNLTIEDLKNFYEENLIVLVDELGTGTPTWLYKIDPKNNATLYDVFNLLQCTKNSYVGFPYEVLSSKPQTIANVKTLKACIEYVERLKVMLNDLVFTVNNNFRGFVMSNTGDVIVDWGDGIIQHFAGGSNQLRAHVYPEYPEASYEIKVKAPLITSFEMNHDNNGSVTTNSLESIAKLPAVSTLDIATNVASYIPTNALTNLSYVDLTDNNFNPTIFNDLLIGLDANGITEGNLLLRGQQISVKYLDLSEAGQIAFDSLASKDWIIEMDEQLLKENGERILLETGDDITIEY